MDFSPNWAVPETAPPNSFVPTGRTVRHRAFAWRKLRERNSHAQAREKLRILAPQLQTERSKHRRHFPAITGRGKSRMPICSRAPEETPADQKHEPEWREPPGMLGEYVRRVKLLSDAKTRRKVQAEP
jgi:hypothetical protein